MDGNEIIVCVIYWKFLVCKLTLITDDILYVTRFPQHCIIINFLSVIKAYGGIKSCLVFCHFFVILVYVTFEQFISCAQYIIFL